MIRSWSGLKEREKIKLGLRMQEEPKGLGAAKNRTGKATYHLYYYFFLLKLKKIILILIHTSQVNSC